MNIAIHWDLSEMVGEANFAFKQNSPFVEGHDELMSATPVEWKHLLADLAAIALRDMAAGTDNLSDFVESNIGSRYLFLGLFFKAQAMRWYKEMTWLTDFTARDFDWYVIDDITQLTPMMLRVAIHGGYYHENPDACLDITEYPSI